MGGLFSRWRTKPSTVEVLENIDKEIQALEEFREKNQRLQKLWVGRLILYSSILYLFTCLIVYLWYLPDELTARLAMTLPFFAFPLIIKAGCPDHRVPRRTEKVLLVKAIWGQKGNTARVEQMEFLRKTKLDNNPATKKIKKKKKEKEEAEEGEEEEEEEEETIIAPV